MVTHISDVSELVLAANAIRSEWNGEVWWRGQSSVNYSLVPGVFRGERGIRSEQNLSLRFRQYARTRYTACPTDDDFCSWLFLAQHYGLPTRLLDWSESALVALYFAVNGDPLVNASLVVLHPREMNRSTNEDHTLVPVSAQPAGDLFRGAFDDRYTNEKTVAVLSHELDSRMLVQQGVFTLHGTSQEMRDIDNSSTFLRVFTIPAGAKTQIIAELASLGIRRRTLFPDLTNLADDLKELVFSENGMRTA